MGHAPVTKLTAKGRATRERIVRAASALMLARGVARTTIEDIQEAANVSTSQMYHYFSDKGDLVAAVIDLQSNQVLGNQQLELHRVDTDPLARARLTRAFAQWEDLIRDGLEAIAARGELPPGLDVGRLALAMLAGVQGGLLLSQVRRDTGPLEAAVDAMIEHLRSLGVR
jgi:AcrR family transcriptional regulator